MTIKEFCTYIFDESVATVKDCIRVGVIQRITDILNVDVSYRPQRRRTFVDPGFTPSNSASLRKPETVTECTIRALCSDAMCVNSASAKRDFAYRIYNVVKHRKDKITSEERAYAIEALHYISNSLTAVSIKQDIAQWIVWIMESE